MSDQKNAMREQARDVRSRLSFSLDDAEAASAHFFEAANPQPGQIVAAYWPKGKEFDVRIIIEDCLKKGLAVALPIVTEGRVMDFALWRDGEPLVNNRFNIPEPEKREMVVPDIVIVPFLAFDRRGYRLGYGGGYYDATLEALRARKEIVAAGVGYGEQAVLFNLPIDEHDQRLDLVITPKGVFDYR